MPTWFSPIQEWILSKNLVLLYSFDLYDAWSQIDALHSAIAELF
jgi:hypothetical protein